MALMKSMTQPAGWMATVFLLFNFLTTAAQEKKKAEEEEDPYIVSYRHALMGRVYLSKRYTAAALQADATNELQYKPNSLLSLGVNMTYRGLGLSLGKGFDFLNPSREERGKTRSFDFQTHLYARHWVTDLYAQWYKGYYINQSRFDNTDGNKYYIRPDVRSFLLGASVYRLLNGDRFSYRAGFSQNEWQKKSAGSLLIGGEVYYGLLKGDSALVPGYLSGFYPQKNVRRVRLIEIGPGVGYAYTAVWRENFFLTGGLTVQFDYSMVKETKENESATRGSVSPNALLRIVGGYSNEEWAFTIGWVHNATNALGASSNQHYRIKTGSFGITLARRLTAGEKFKKTLDPIVEKIP